MRTIVELSGLRLSEIANQAVCTFICDKLALCTIFSCDKEKTPRNKFAENRKKFGSQEKRESFSVRQSRDEIVCGEWRWERRETSSLRRWRVNLIYWIMVGTTTCSVRVHCRWMSSSSSRISVFWVSEKVMETITLRVKLLAVFEVFIGHWMWIDWEDGSCVVVDWDSNVLENHVWQDSRNVVPRVDGFLIAALSDHPESLKFYLKLFQISTFMLWNIFVPSFLRPLSLSILLRLKLPYQSLSRNPLKFHGNRLYKDRLVIHKARCQLRKAANFAW